MEYVEIGRALPEETSELMFFIIKKHQNKHTNTILSMYKNERSGGIRAKRGHMLRDSSVARTFFIPQLLKRRNSVLQNQPSSTWSGVITGTANIIDTRFITITLITITEALTTPVCGIGFC